MSYYAGLDVSLEETAICVVDAMGRIVKEMRAPSEPEALVTALRETGLAFERIGLEACSLQLGFTTRCAAQACRRSASRRARRTPP
jgi:predicted NBD/HSP70 family sugar kinase